MSVEYYFCIMFIEIKVVLNFLLSFLYDKLPRRRVNLFGEEVERQLKLKLSATNWSSEQDDQVSNNLHESRTLSINKKEMLVEPLIVLAATDTAMDLKEIMDCMPDYLKIFIEPGLVAYTTETIDLSKSDKIHNFVKTLYKLPQVELSNLEYRIAEPELVRESSESPVSSSSSLSSSSSNTDNNFAYFDHTKSVQRSNSYFTPAEFAKTKFGSTKSKESFLSNAKPKIKITQSSQNSEFAAYIKQKLQQQSIKKPSLIQSECMDNFVPQSTNLLLSNLTKSTSFTSGFSSMPSTNFYNESSRNFDFLVSSTIQGMIDCHDEDKNENF